MKQTNKTTTTTESAFAKVEPKAFGKALKAARLAGERRAKTDPTFAALNETERFFVSLAVRSVEARKTGDTLTADALAHVVDSIGTPTPPRAKAKAERMTPGEFAHEAAQLPAHDQRLLQAFMTGLAAMARPEKDA